MPGRRARLPPPTKPTGLRTSFPQPGEVTYTSIRQDGPTKVVDGNWSAGLDEADKEYKDQGRGSAVDHPL